MIKKVLILPVFEKARIWGKLIHSMVIEWYHTFKEDIVVFA